MRTFALSLAMLASVSAFAAPLQFNHQGRLLDDAGAPLTGTASITLSLYNDATSSSAAWTEVHPDIALDAGYYSLSVGSISTIDASFFDGSTKYLGISVDGTELPTRVPVLSVPYSLRAASAGTADALKAGAALDVGSITVNGSPLADNDTLGDLNCSTDQVPVFDGSEWTCGEAGSELTSVPAEIITGTIAISNLPVGTGGTQVASGDHTHSAADVGALADTTKAVDIGGVGVGTFGTSCSGTNTIVWNSGSMYACNGSAWVKLTFAQDGSSAANAAASCLAILNGNPGAANGQYWIDPDGSGSTAAAQTTCDMTGGGWTRAYASDFANNTTGWSNNGRSTCGTIGPLLGGFNIFGLGASTQFVVSLTGRPHTQIRVNHTFVKIDSWDGHQGRMQVDAAQVWAKAYTGEGSQVCGQTNSGWNELADPIVTTVNHTANTATIRFDSTLDQAADDESWGIKDIVVWYR